MTNNISDTLRMMDVVDGIQRARAQQTGLVESDEALMAKVRDVYVSQGLPVDDEVLGVAFQQLYGRLPGEQRPLVPLVARDEAGLPVRPVFPESRVIEEKLSPAAIMGLLTIVFGGGAVAWLWSSVRSPSVPSPPVEPAVVAPSVDGVGQIATQLEGMAQVLTAGMFVTGIMLGALACIKFKTYSDGLNEVNDGADPESAPEAPKTNIATPLILVVVSAALLAAPALLSVFSV